MSMIGNLARLTDATRQELHRQPELINAFLYPGMASQTPQPRPGFFGRIFGKKQPVAPNPVSSRALEPLKIEDALDIDKAWHALHFLFSGSDWEGDLPQGFLVSCGEPVGDVDVGYGPARSFTPQEVQKIAEFLDGQTEAALRSRMDWKKMEELEIYPSIWSEERKEHWEEEWEYFRDAFCNLKSFVRETAQRKMALLVYLN